VAQPIFDTPLTHALTVYIVRPESPSAAAGWRLASPALEFDHLVTASALVGAAELPGGPGATGA